MSRLFNSRKEAIVSRARREDLVILVWGPGNPGPNASEEKRAAYEKRKQVKSVLKREFPYAEVHFSEDRSVIKLTEGPAGQLEKEALQAKLADFVIMLDTSRGVDLELDHFVPTYPWFRDKVHVFLPEAFVKNRRSLVGVSILDKLPTHQLEGFSEDEFEKCYLVKRAIKVAEWRAMDRMLRE